MKFYVKNVFPFFIFFSGFQSDFIRCVDSSRIAASNTASDDIINYVTHRIFNTD